MNTREAFLQRVRQAVIDGNRAGATPPLPKRGSVGYQGAGTDPAQRFCEELKAVGGFPHLASDREAPWQAIHEIIEAAAARKIMVGRGGLIDWLDLPARLSGAGLEVTRVYELAGSDLRDTFFAADVGISNVEHLVAETGTVVMASGPDDPRSLSLLPPVHIALAKREQILPDLFDLFDRLDASPQAVVPSCLTLITGPSKTGDIELRLVTGVHGPGQVHVVLM